MENIFYINNAKTDARLLVKNEKSFILLKDSKLNIDYAPSFLTHNYYKNYIKGNKLKMKNDILLEDYTFSSSSGAAAIALGRAANGKTEWKTIDGIIIEEIYYSNDNEENYKLINTDFNEYFMEFKNNQYDNNYMKDIEKKIKNFQEEYPLDRLQRLSLEEYALGTENSKESLSAKLEYGKYASIGSIKGATAAKFGIYYHRDGSWKNTREDIVEPYKYWEDFRLGLYKFIVATGKDYGTFGISDLYPEIKNMGGTVKTKLLSLYYPDKFLFIYSKYALISLIKYFGIYENKLWYNETEDLNVLLLNYIYKNYENIKNENIIFLSQCLWALYVDITSKDIVSEVNGNENDKIQIKSDTDYVFINDDDIQKINNLLERKKNIILQGPPGVGKTFIANNILKLDQNIKKENIEMVQFHQSYSYEDFVQGYRPNKEGKFELKDGVIYKLAKKAISSSNERFYLIIDEINRGNLSKIFGELLLLIESDKRKEKYNTTLTYSDKKFYMPGNLYIIGTMNTADRSLEMVDYALRRRFAFIDIFPAFGLDKMKKYLREEKGLDNQFIDIINTKFNKLNEVIRLSLGKGFEIGHSYFITEYSDTAEETYQDIITYEIEPLLKEYWFDDDEKVKEALKIISL